MHLELMGAVLALVLAVAVELASYAVAPPVEIETWSAAAVYRTRP